MQQFTKVFLMPMNYIQHFRYRVLTLTTSINSCISPDMFMFTFRQSFYQYKWRVKVTQASLGFPNPPFRLWGPHFCEQDPPISANHTHIFKGPKTSYHSAFSPLTWINWIVNADFPTPPPPTTTRRYFSCTEPSFQPAIGDTLLLSLRCLNTRTPSHFTL